MEEIERCPIDNGSVSLFGRDNLPDSTLENMPLQENAATALETLDADIGSQSDHLPLVTAAGVDLLQANYIVDMNIR
jgi:hypothetical protein